MSIREAGIRSWWPLGVLLAVVALSLAVACNGNGGTEPTIEIKLASPVSTESPSPTATPTPAPSPSPTATPTPIRDVCGVNPDPAPPSVLQVQEPQSGERVKNPFHVRGWGSEIGKEDGGVIVALVDATGEPLLDKDVSPESRAGRIAAPGLKVTDFTAPFATDVLVQNLSTATPFCLWVFLETTSEGIPKQVVQVPIVVAP